MIADNEHASQVFTPGEALECKSRHRCAIMCQQNPVVVSCPLQDFRVGATLDGKVLRQDDIDVRLAQSEATNNVLVKVFVSEETQHFSQCVGVMEVIHPIAHGVSCGS